MGQSLWSEKELYDQKRTVQKFRRVLLEIFDVYSESGLYTIEYSLPTCMVKDIRIFETLCILDSSSHDYFIAHIKEKYRKALQKRRIRTME